MGFIFSTNHDPSFPFQFGGQEPGTAQEVETWAREKYGASWYFMEKVFKVFQIFCQVRSIFMEERSNHHLHVVEISRWRSTVPAPTPSLPFSRPPNLASSSTPSSGTSPSFSSTGRASQWQGGGGEVQYLHFRNSNQLLRFGPNDSVVPTVEAEIQKLL